MVPENVIQPFKTFMILDHHMKMFFKISKHPKGLKNPRGNPLGISNLQSSKASQQIETCSHMGTCYGFEESAWKPPGNLQSSKPSPNKSLKKVLLYGDLLRF